MKCPVCKGSRYTLIPVSRIPAAGEVICSTCKGTGIYFNSICHSCNGYALLKSGSGIGYGEKAAERICHRCGGTGKV